VDGPTVHGHANGPAYIDRPTTKHGRDNKCARRYTFRQ